MLCVLLASETRQEEGHGEVQKGQGPSQQIGRQSQKEGVSSSKNGTSRRAPFTLDIGLRLELF